jgi:hypothetical protein
VDVFGLAPRGVDRKKPNQISTDPGKRRCWKIERYSRTCEGTVPGVGYVKYLFDPKTKQWWSQDKTAHGDSAWKVHSENGTWKHDADVYGDYLENKHKGATGRNIDFDSLRCKDA